MSNKCHIIIINNNKYVKIVHDRELNIWIDHKLWLKFTGNLKSSSWMKINMYISYRKEIAQIKLSKHLFGIIYSKENSFVATSSEMYMTASIVVLDIIWSAVYSLSDLMICFDSELFSQNFVWHLNNDRKSLDLYYECLK